MILNGSEFEQQPWLDPQRHLLELAESPRSLPV